MSTQANFEKLMKLREARDRADERYVKACVKYEEAVSNLGFSECKPKLLQYKGKMYFVESTAKYTRDIISIKEVEYEQDTD